MYLTETDFPRVLRSTQWQSDTTLKDDDLSDRAGVIKERLPSREAMNDL